MTSPPAPGHGGGSTTARTVIGCVLLLVDLAIAGLWASVVGTADTSSTRATFVVGALSAGLGALCVVAVIILDTRRRGPTPPTRPNRNTAVSVLALVAGLKLVVGFLALVVLGAFADANGLQVLVVALVESAALLWLTVGAARHVARGAAGS